MEPLTTATVCILIVFSCCGTILNGLVLFVLLKSKAKHTSTIYVLILAFVDLFTCAFTIPICIAMEFLEFETESDELCKSYHLLATTTVPLSAILMAVIAVDRYIRICTRKHVFITTTKILATVIVTVLFSLVLGCICSMGYGVEKIDANFPNTNGNFSDACRFFNSCQFMNFNSDTNFVGLTNMSINLKEFAGDFGHFELNHSINMITGFGVSLCKLSTAYVTEEFMDIYHIIYSLVYALSCFVAIFIYCKIYFFVASSRHRTILRYNPDFLLKPIPSSLSEETSKDELHRIVTKSKSAIKTFVFKREKIKRQNIKTASMLASVAAVFTASFLPAWLMKYRFLPFNDFVFHLYFIYCIINPLIYAFCNSKFKKSLKQMLSGRGNPVVL